MYEWFDSIKWVGNAFVSRSQGVKKMPRRMSNNFVLEPGYAFVDRPQRVNKAGLSI